MDDRFGGWETATALTEARAMEVAVRLAWRATGRVEPNPRVGCVLLDGDGDAQGRRRILGQGFHRRFGAAHAEVNALADARRRGGAPSAGFTAVVTLEPCCHVGKTPPCVEALLAAGVGRVVVGETDPDPRVSGRGLERLRAAGVEVCLAGTEGTRWLLGPFRRRIERGRPWVVAKWAQTVDGKIAASTGDSKWISNEVSRRWVHRLRARVDAVVTGVGTVVADDPSLTARGVRVHRVARRVVLDRSGRTPAGAKLRVDGGPSVELSAEEPATLLRRLAAEGCTRVLLEAGPGLTGAFFAAGLVDEVHVYVGPRLLGDPAGFGPATLGPAETIASARRLELRSATVLGGDVALVYAVPE